MKISMEKLVGFAKEKGYIFAGSEIYGGLSNTWDYGPLGVELKNNIKDEWRKTFIRKSKYNVGLDAAILMNPKVWEASGHLSNFSDPLMDCKECKTRHRADKIIEEWMFKHGIDGVVDGWSDEKMHDYIIENNIVCPTCGKLNYTPIRKFNLMFKTFQGVTEDKKAEIYLRPETAQGIFVNFKNAFRAVRGKLPFGIAQIGKSFRNEITPGNFIFRTREFEQMELEFFFDPQDEKDWFSYWKDICYNWLIDHGMKKENIRRRDHSKEELSHYSAGTTDLEYLFPFGWGELWGIANRTDFDLRNHQQFSGENLEVMREDNTKFIPHVIEPSVGCDRVLLAFLCDAYHEETLEDGDTRVVLKLDKTLAPYKVAVLPLSKKLSEDAEKVYEELQEYFSVTFDETGSIGKRYRRQDEIGTPYCVTFDFDSLEDKMVTVRDRDTMEQERVEISKLTEYLRKKLEEK